MSYTLLKPVKFDFNSDTPLTPTEVEQFQIFTHYLILQNFYCNYKFKERKFTEVYSQLLQKKIFTFKTQQRILDWYENSNYYLIVDKRYSNYEETRKFKGYRLNFLGTFEVESYQVEFNAVNEKKFKALFNRETPQILNDFERENNDKQLNFINKLKFDDNEYLNVLPKVKEKYEKKKEIGLNYINHLQIQQNECYNFLLKKNFSSYDDFSKRYYNFFTNKSSLIRDCFKLNGKILGSSDISNSQPYFFSQLDRIDLSNYLVDKSKIKIDNSFRELVVRGEIYEYLSIRLDLTKDETKIQLLSFFYGDTRYKRLERLIEDEFPITYLTIKYLQSIETNDTKFNFTKTHKIKTKNEDIEIETEKKTYFNYLLQSIERDIFLKAFESLEDFYTVHDSVYYEGSRKNEFDSAIYTQLKKFNLDLPKIK